MLRKREVPEWETVEKTPRERSLTALPKSPLHICVVCTCDTEGKVGDTPGDFLYDE